MRKCLLTVLLITLPITLNAALLGRDLDGNLNTAEAFYDDDANLTWLADANASAGSVYDIAYPGTGRMTWDDANTWVAGLDFDGINGWRLPSQLNPDATCSIQDAYGLSYGQNCTGSEMGNLFFNVLGGVAGTSIQTTHNDNFNLFSDIKSNYWSSAEYVFAVDNQVGGSFNFDMSIQNYTDKAISWYGWAVHDGDVGAAVVPIPAAVWLFGSGLIGLVGLARRKQQSLGA